MGPIRTDVLSAKRKGLSCQFVTRGWRPPSGIPFARGWSCGRKITCQEFVVRDQRLAGVGGLVTATAERLGNPLLGALAMTLTTRLWHVPAAFELALRSLARRGARVLLHGRTSLLVARGACVALPAALVARGDDPVPAARRRPEHARPAVNHVDASRRGR